MKKLNVTINFDMDGTIADLYGVENWLDYLIAENTFPYANAKPLLHLSALARKLNNLQRMGYELAIISWLSKSGSDEYNEAVTEAKERWLARLPQCEYCGEHIQDEYFYEINGEWICKACLDDQFKRENTLLEDDE